MRVERAAVLACLLAAASGCGTRSDGAEETTLATLVGEQRAFDGRRVVVSGTLRTYRSPRHYWLEDDAGHRVALEPEVGLAPRVGERLRVRGRFTYAPDRGRVISVETLRRAREP